MTKPNFQQNKPPNPNTAFPEVSPSHLTPVPHPTHLNETNKGLGLEGLVFELGVVSWRICVKVMEFNILGIL